jgi:anti-sigma B factor antagonist
MVEIEGGPGSRIVCRPAGYVDFRSAAALRHVITDLLEAGVEIVIDLRHVGSIDAVGISVIVGSIRRVRARGGTVQVSNANRRVACLLTLAGAYRLTAPAAALSPGAA